MKNTIRAIALVGGIFLVAGLGVSSLAVGGEGSATPTTTSSPSDGDDFKGPCDEAEHANDPECQGVILEPEDDVDDGVEPGEDVSGPCDEAEHANDPECRDGSVDDDNSGPGSGDETEDHSGPGSGEDAEGNSGPSENSGPGNADDHDNSGPGSSEDD